MENYNIWLEKVTNDEKSILKNMSQDEITEAFYKNIEFGTAGLRGKTGLGTSKMNYYTVGRATQGIANFITSLGEDAKKQGVVIAYDCRHFSREFAFYSAEIFSTNGITAYIYDQMRSTPQLSYSITELNCKVGINMTASHNPKEYTGYKVYFEDGAQVSGEIADKMTEKINQVDMFSDIKTGDKSKLVTLNEDLDEKYIKLVKSLAINDDNINKNIKIVYTPLNGAGKTPINRILKDRGFTNLHLVKEQSEPDPDFTTVGYPNPEDTKAFAYAEKLGLEIGAKLLIATDPDADRIAIEVMQRDGTYRALNGNQVGVLLINYILQSKNSADLKDTAMVKSIVTGNMSTEICNSYGVKMFDALTGFKNICGQIPKLEKLGLKYIFGYEESIGYSPSISVRDKDGIATAMLLCEACAYYDTQNKTLLDVLYELFEKYGYYAEEQISIELDGVEGQERISRMMTEYRSDYIKTFGDMSVSQTIDYKNGHDDIPPSNVLKFILDDGSFYALRPSGTEPKIKLYIYTKENSEEKSFAKIKILKEAIFNRLDQIK